MRGLTELKECKKHGSTIHAVRENGRLRCMKCDVEHVTEWRRKTKRRAVEYKGGKCILCGYDKWEGALVFHHTENNKSFSIGDKGFTRAWEKMTGELDKCVLLCLNCHQEVHAGIAELAQQ